MPQNSNTPPPVMTWAKALPVLIVAGVFDTLRAFFELFWFFGPALAAVACTAAGSTYVGTVVAGVACTTAAAVAGFFGAGAIEVFGIVMSMALGFLGFLVLGLWVTLSNARIFKANTTGMIWLMGSLGVSLVPFIGAIPSFTLSLIKLYRVQIRVEKLAFKQFQASQAAAQLQERRRQEALLQERAAQTERERQEEEMRQAEEEEAQAARDARTDAALKETELAEQRFGEAANDAQFAPRAEAANDGVYSRAA